MIRISESGIGSIAFFTYGLWIFVKIYGRRVLTFWTVTGFTFFISSIVAIDIVPKIGKFTILPIFMGWTMGLYPLAKRVEKLQIERISKLSMPMDEKEAKIADAIKWFARGVRFSVACFFLLLVAIAYKIYLDRTILNEIREDFLWFCRYIF